MSAHPYLTEVHRALPRVLALFDTNPISTMRGVGDRYRWAWKGTDFANGTFQSAVHGLALLVANGLLPAGMQEEKILQRIHETLDGIRAITHRNGSLDEILPGESSYCVTALVAFDALCALDILRARMSDAERARHRATIAPLVQFLTRARESHGVITNHLAVAAAALVRWQAMTGEDVSAARDAVLKIILAHRSDEGWFREYDGADAGYQTLALDYLSDIAEQAPALGLAPLLDATCAFLCHCAHPDGSFGGLYGSRNTRFLYPAGIETLAAHSAHASALAAFARTAHSTHRAVGLAMMDDANLIPMFTSFCRAAARAHVPHVAASTLPHASAPFQQQFPEAGLIVSRTEASYSVVNWRKGAISAFADGTTITDGGVLARDGAGRWFSSQLASNDAALVSADAQQIVIDLPLQRVRQQYPSPLQMVILRLLCLSVMRVSSLNALIKKILVRLLVSPKRTARNRVRRTITLQPQVCISDMWLDHADGLTLQPAPTRFHAVHMASQGYWQRGDDV